MSEDEQPVDVPEGELLPPREVMSLIDGAGLTGTGGTGGLLGTAGVPTADPTQAGDPTQAAGIPDTSQQVAPAHGLTDSALQQAQSAQGTSDPDVSQTATS
jgi:hypothetical protein